MRAAAFARYEGAFGLGHVGWGFDFDAAGADCGSVENPSGLPYCPPAAMGFWDKRSNDPVSPMKDYKYIDAKYVDLDEADPQKAYAVVLWVSQQPYLVLRRNCLDDVYDVLRAYGVPDLPPPSHDWNPNEWFGLWIAGPTYVHLDEFNWGDRPAKHIAAMATLASPARLGDVKPEAPPWRVVGSPEFEDLQAQLAQVSSNASIRRHAARYYEMKA